MNDKEIIEFTKEDLEMLEIFKKINFKIVGPFGTMLPKAFILEFNGNITEEEYNKWLKWKEKNNEKRTY